jgi:2-polyprenyl-3-methyl-5-hydroxy-6-metoxy-1,4-benzoquinol methylase
MVGFVDQVRNKLAGVPYPWGHDHRTWEYGLVLNALIENNAHTVLDVGGGGAIFLSCARLMGLDICTVDPADDSASLKGQEERLGVILPWVQEDFFTFNSPRQYDAVTCISVIEHVPNDLSFFDKLLSFVALDGLLCLTTDFHPSGVQVFGGHIRTYNASTLEAFVRRAEMQGFVPFGDLPNYGQFTHQIFNLYSFGSLILKRVR